MAQETLYRSIPEQIARELRHDILSGRLPADTSLREVTLSERFQVSRGPIRDALARLTQEGLLVAKPNKGVKVARAPSAEIRPILISLRKQIEVFVLESIFAEITSEDLSRWDAILDEIHEACSNGDENALKELDIRFHTAIIESHDERDLLELWKPIVMRMMITYSRHENLMDSYSEHKQIIDAIRAGNKRDAIAHLKANIV